MNAKDLLWHVPLFFLNEKKYFFYFGKTITQINTRSFTILWPYEKELRHHYLVWNPDILLTT